MPKEKAPWQDYNGRLIHEGDFIRHPSGDSGVVVFLPDEDRASDQWRVDYGKSHLLRLCLQIGDKGQAIVVDTVEEALKPCPFCGSVARAYEIEAHTHILVNMPDHPGSAFAECHNCTAIMSGKTLAAVIAAWNTRTTNE